MIDLISGNERYPSIVPRSACLHRVIPENDIEIKIREHHNFQKNVEKLNMQLSEFFDVRILRLSRRDHFPGELSPTVN